MAALRNCLELVVRLAASVNGVGSTTTEAAHTSSWLGSYQSLQLSTDSPLVIFIVMYLLILVKTTLFHFVISDIVQQVEDLSSFQGVLVTAKLRVPKVFFFGGLETLKLMVSKLLPRVHKGLPSQLHSLLKDGSFLTCGGSIGIGSSRKRANCKVDIAVVRLLLPQLSSDVQLVLAHIGDAQWCSLARSDGSISSGSVSFGGSGGIFRNEMSNWCWDIDENERGSLLGFFFWWPREAAQVGIWAGLLLLLDGATGVDGVL